MPTDLDLQISTYRQRMLASATPSCRLSWAKEYVRRKAKRGDYASVVQGEMGEDLIEALARHEMRATVENGND